MPGHRVYVHRLHSNDWDRHDVVEHQTRTLRWKQFSILRFLSKQVVFICPHHNKQKREERWNVKITRDTTGRQWTGLRSYRAKIKRGLKWKSKPDSRRQIQRKEHWWLGSRPTKQWRWWHRASWELFIQASQTKDRGRGCWRGGRGGRGTGMIWLPWQNV